MIPAVYDLQFAGPVERETAVVTAWTLAGHRRGAHTPSDDDLEEGAAVARALLASALIIEREECPSFSDVLRGHTPPPPLGPRRQ